jgi:iturin family lipopeptide synthetase C
VNNKIEKTNVEDIFELSMVQKGMLFHYLNEENNNLYNAQLAFNIDGDLNIDILKEGLKIVQKNNEVLRSVFSWEKVSTPLQIILKNAPIDFKYLDVSVRGHSEGLNYVNEYITSDQKARFDLTTVPFRVTVIRSSETNFTLLITNHHILYDGWSTGILLKELFQIYNQLAHHTNTNSTPKIGYKIHQQNIQKKLSKNDELFWKEYLAEYELHSLFPNKTSEITLLDGVQKISLTTECKKIEYFSIQNRVTKASIVYTAVGILLQKYKDESDIVFGTTVSNRNSAINGNEHVIGNFINTIPFRMGDFNNKSFLEAVKGVNEDGIKINQYGHTSYYEVKNLLNLKSTESLFDVIVVVENYPLDEDGINVNSEFKLNLKSVYENTGIPMVITVFFKEQLEIEVIYESDLIEKYFAEAFIDHLSHVLHAIVDKSEQPVNSFSYLSEKESHEFIREFNNTECTLPIDDTVISLFEKQAQLNPENNAVTCGEEVLSYKELNDKSDQIAFYLREEKRVKSDDLIGLMLDRNIDLVPIILGILKVGAAYVPIDPTYPIDRINSILDSSSLAALITKDSYQYQDLHAPSIVIDVDHALESITSCRNSIRQQLNGDNLAYVIFTSGSTGTPKGVMIEHGTLLNYIFWAAEVYVENTRTTFPLYSSISFDLTITSIFTPLITGNTIVVYEEDEKSVLIEKVLLDNKVDIVKLTPSHLKIIKESELLKSLNSRVGKFIVGGEDFETKLAKDIFDKFGGDIKIYNEYGPTEATVGCMIQEFDPKNSSFSVPLGVPINNTQIYILDKSMNPVPKGITGEIYISGSGVARGYLLCDDLTEQRFLENPFIKGNRMYRTGDYAKRLNDGSIVFIGRIDEQVKIAGYRIELKDIENHLISHEQIDQSVVTTKEKEGVKYLVAYFQSEYNLNALELRNYLSDKLPVYMLPSYFVRMESFPLTINGKLDFKSLPEPEATGSEDYEAPRTKEEQLLVEQWSKVLDIPKLGITDNYFSIGGDSIKSIQISSRMRSAGYELSVQDIFKYPTIKQLATKLKHVVRQSNQSLITGNVLLSPIQKWFFDSTDIDRHHFNQSVLLNFKEGISVDEVSALINKIIEHHDALRITFADQGAEVEQKNNNLELQASIEEFDLKKDNDAIHTLQEIGSRIQSSIDLEKGPLLKLAAFHLNDGTRLLIVIHHLVIDGVSWRILIEDLEMLYQQLQSGLSLSLPLKTDSFQLWSAHLVKYIESKTFKKASNYWSNLTEENAPSLPRDYVEGLNIFKDHKKESFSLGKEYTGKLIGNIHNSFGTQINDLLLVALLIAVNDQFGHTKVQLDLEGHGRENIGEGINVSRTIGWFTSIFPVLLSRPSENLNEVIKHVKETLRSIPNKGMDYLLLKYLDKKQSISEGTSQISFNYLGQFESQNNNFSIATECRGNEISPNIQQNYDWNIIGQISENDLQIDLVYSTQQYNTDTIRQFLNLYKQNLMDVIQYCDTYGKPELTPSDLIFKKLSIDELDKIQDVFDIENIYSLSPTQEGMLFHSVLKSDSEIYFEQKTLSLKGDVDVYAVEKSMNDLISRYDIFRTMFVHKGYARPLQIVLKERSIDFTFADVQSECQNSTKDQIIESYKIKDRLKTFDLGKDTLMRIVLLQTDVQEFILIWTHHHILMDGWCTSIVWNDFRTFYSNFINNAETPLPTPKKYAEYIAWLEEKDNEISREYWRKYLEDYQNLAKLPTIESKISKENPIDLSSHEINIDVKATNALSKVSKENSVTISTILQAAWGIVLGKYNNTKDVVFGSVVSGRPAEISGIENMVGLFINTVPTRVRFSEHDTLGNLLHNCQALALKSEDHHYHPLQEIQGLSELGNGLFNHIMVFENYPISTKIIDTDNYAKDDFIVTDVEIFAKTNYDLTLVIIPSDDIKIKIEYNQKLYSKDVIENVLGHYERAIIEIINNVEVEVVSLDLVSEDEKLKLLEKLDNVDVKYPYDKTIVDLFTDQVKRVPQNIAIKCNNDTITYKELDEKSSRYAALLRNEGVIANSIVGLLMDRTIETVVGMLAILKAGGAYLPIDINYPTERRDYIINDSGTKIILTTRAFTENVKAEVKLLCIEDLELQPFDKHFELHQVKNPSDLCYVIYTSGTTGNPKGVMVEHRNVVRLLFNNKFQFDFNDNDVWTMFHSHCFDFSVWEIYGALFYGGKLVIIPQMVARDTKAYLEILKKEKVTILNQTPSAFYNLIQAESQEQEASLNVRKIIFGGEALSPGKLKKWRTKYPKVGLINMFGITETTVHVTYKEIGDFEIENNISNIGKPIPTLSVLVLDEQKRLVPKGVVGEMYVGGAGVARGYLNKTELTNLKFIPNPYNNNERLYRSGDLARVLESGEIEYIGRMDHQIQLRGFRIELGEIENQLIKHNLIKEVSVVAKELEGDKCLLAYYVADKEFDVAEIRKFLLDKLPDHMVPSYFLQLDQIPLTSNGKLDYKALPDPKLRSIENTSRPNNQTQKELVSIWAELLAIDEEKIGVNTNFFEIGGNSLKIMKMVDMINGHFNVEITVAKVFACPVISLLAEFLNTENIVETETDALIETDLEQMNDTLDLLNQI